MYLVIYMYVVSIYKCMYFPLHSGQFLLKNCTPFSCKYMLRSFTDHASTTVKKEILAIISSFPHSGFSSRITGNICYYYKSFVGRDFKAWLQMCVFVLHRYLSTDEIKCWLLLAKMKFLICSCL